MAHGVARDFNPGKNVMALSASAVGPVHIRIFDRLFMINSDPFIMSRAYGTLVCVFCRHMDEINFIPTKCPGPTARSQDLRFKIRLMGEWECAFNIY